MLSDGAGRDAAGEQRRRGQARWLVVGGFVIWSVGLALWEWSWFGGLAANLVGAVALTNGLTRLAQGSASNSSQVWPVTALVTVSLVLISQGVGQEDFRTRVVLTGLGTLGMILALLRILDERLTVERQLTRRTLTDQRRRLAGDVHDVVGHTLSASMLHTTAARLSVRSDPDAAIASLERAERHGRRSMDDIRSVVRLLRDDAGTGAPVPLAGELPELVEGIRSGGAEVRFTTTGDLDDLSTATALTVYRVVQEGLTNAVRHGTGAIELSVDAQGPGEPVEIWIGNAAVDRAAPMVPGSGLAGMRERVAAVGGTLEAGSANGGRRWMLSARVPT